MAADDRHYSFEWPFSQAHVAVPPPPAAMQAYAERMWDDRRDPKTGLFSFGDTGHTQMIEQAAMVQVLALLAWTPSRYRLLL